LQQPSASPAQTCVCHHSTLRVGAHLSLIGNDKHFSYLRSARRTQERRSSC